MGRGTVRIASTGLTMLGLLVLVVACALALGLLAPAAQAANKHVFDPVLSLEGDCEPHAPDTVADPGCVGEPPAYPAGNEPTLFKNICGVAVDSKGYIYVSGGPFASEEGWLVQVFDPKGVFLTMFKAPRLGCRLAVDSAGRVYQGGEGKEHGQRYTPDSYPPSAATKYTATDIPEATGVAVDPTNDHYYLARDGFTEYKPNGEPIGVSEVQRLAVDAGGGGFNLIFSPAAAAATANLSAGSASVSGLLTATGTGDLGAGSTAVSSVVLGSGEFEVGQPIAGAGIPGGTTVAEVTRGAGPASGFLRLSQPASASGTGVALSSAGPGPFGAYKGKPIVGPGIAPGTTIEAASAGSLTLSKNATAGGSGVPVYTGNELPTLAGTGGTAHGNLSGGSPTVTSLASVVGEGEVTANFVNNPTETFGEFRVGQTISGAGIPPGTTITRVSPGFSLALSRETSAPGKEAITAQDPFAPGEEVTGPGIPPGTTIAAVGEGSLTLSANATAGGSEVPLSAAIPFDASPATVRGALEALPAIGAGDVSVSGGPGGPGAATPYQVTFTGALADTDVAQLIGVGEGLSGGSASATVTTTTPGYDGRFGPAVRHADVDVWHESGHFDVYTASPGASPGPTVRVYDGVDHHLTAEVKGVTAPDPFAPSIAVDPETGDFYVYDKERERVDHFCRNAATGGFALCEEIKEPKLPSTESSSDLAVEGSPEAPAASRGHLFVSSGAVGGDHLFAFAPAGAPEVCCEGASQITAEAATLEGEVNPKGNPATYHFEYTSEADYKENGWVNATSVPDPAGEVPGGAAITVSAPLTGLQADTAYRFRLVATTHCNPAEPAEECSAEGPGMTFSTYAEPPISPEPCPNAALRTGPAAALPDCRAYELVTPPDTGAVVPLWAGPGLVGGNGIDTSLAAPGGGSLMFASNSGALPGMEGNGTYDVYEALRREASGEEPGGWESRGAGPSGAQARYPEALGVSPDHGYGLWQIYHHGGSLDIGAGALPSSFYLRYPGAIPHPSCSPEPQSHFELVGCAEPGFENDTGAQPQWITEGAGHLIFCTCGTYSSQAQLAGEAPPSGTSAIYDRSPGGPLHVVSLVPGDEPTSGENAFYQGSSEDGAAVAFKVGSRPDLYLRLDNAKTLVVSEAAGTTFAGISGDGRYAFYLLGGDVFRYDTATETTVQIGAGGKSTVVNVSADGSHVYFASTEPQGGEGTAGKDNLYVWDGAGETVRFIATLDPIDLSGRELPVGSGFFVEGLGLWTGYAASHVGSARDPSRSTPDGSVLVFQSRANLTLPYDSEGHSEVYRYDAAANGGVGGLACLSCNPTGVPASSDARLQSPINGGYPFAATITLARILNVTDDGRRVFFESDERLVPADQDGLTDVYEWEAQGQGGCERSAGCLSLISSGKSAGPDYLYAMTADGHDVFFRTADTLLPRDTGGVPSIYDARVNGGFAEPKPPEVCVDTCQPNGGATPGPTGAASAGLQGEGNVRQRPKPRCPKGRRQVRRHGRTRCVKTHHKHGRHRRRAAR